MELVKDIYFNTDKLIENTKVKVSYTGKFYQGNNEKVYIHYGYGKNWNNVNEVEMVKTDLGYQTELCLLGEDTLNFCFKNQDNEWDNNHGKNYVFNIEKLVSNNSWKKTPKSTENNVVFWGKTYSKNKKSTDGPVMYWTSDNSQDVNTNTPNITENNFNIVNNMRPIANNTPQSVDTVIQNNTSTVTKCNVVPQNYSNTEKSTTNTYINNSTPSVNYTTPVGIPNIKNNTNPSNNVDVKNNNVGMFTKIPNTEVNLNGTVPTGFNKVGITNNTSPMNKSSNVTTNNIQTIPTNIINPIKTQQQTSIIVTPTGFNYWTQKIKTTVLKFFSYFPKLISGNYKRNIDNTNQKQK